MAKHPMAGAGTVRLGKNIHQVGQENAVRNRIVSIATVWIAHYLKEAYSSRGNTITDIMLVRSDRRNFTFGPKPLKANAIHAGNTFRQLLERHSKQAFQLRDHLHICMLDGSQKGKVSYAPDL